MKKSYTLDCGHEYDFVVLAINSHIKAYKLCWFLNQELDLKLEAVDPHKISEELVFTRYRSESVEGETINLLANRSKKGYLIPAQKSINYFFIINKLTCKKKKLGVLARLRKINDILLVFEFPLDKEKNSDRFIIYDKKN
tara:strand:- start:1283 stop:1702 length:420 start_codon:yes stop_codon:yes gene_type:complete